MPQENTYTTEPHFHLVKAMYDWIVENNGTPHIVVPLSEVPPQIHMLGENNQMVLNIAPRSTGLFSLEPELLSFRARFRGVDTAIEINPNKIIAIYDRDTPQVMMMLPPVEAVEEAVPTPKRPSLSVVK